MSYAVYDIIYEVGTFNMVRMLLSDALTLGKRFRIRELFCEINEFFDSKILWVQRFFMVTSLTTVVVTIAVVVTGGY